MKQQNLLLVGMLMICFIFLANADSAYAEYPSKDGSWDFSIISTEQTPIEINKKFLLNTDVYIENHSLNKNEGQVQVNYFWTDSEQILVDTQTIPHSKLKKSSVDIPVNTDKKTSIEIIIYPPSTSDDPGHIFDRMTLDFDPSDLVSEVTFDIIQKENSKKIILDNRQLTSSHTALIIKYVNNDEYSNITIFLDNEPIFQNNDESFEIVLEGDSATDFHNLIIEMSNDDLLQIVPIVLANEIPHDGLLSQNIQISLSYATIECEINKCINVSSPDNFPTIGVNHSEISIFQIMIIVIVTVMAIIIGVIYFHKKHMHDYELSKYYVTHDSENQPKIWKP